MEEQIKKLKEDFYSDFKEKITVTKLEELRIKYLGKKSLLSQLFSQLPNLDKEKKAIFGRKLNALKLEFTTFIEQKSKEIVTEEEKIDLTFPSFYPKRGTKHILSLVSQNICRIFQDLGFVIVEGKEIEDERHNFTALNIPLEHPSRDAFDTFYLDIKPTRDGGNFLLRSHTSPSQIRVMETIKPPLAVISPGRVYRPDKVDASHSFMFFQIEGFVVDRNINFSHLKGVLLYFAKKFFSEDVALRFRPHFFPFTEPSAEVDISCFLCKNQKFSNQKCGVCKGKGWLEILGCGMIHPKVLENCKIDSKKFRGFAFGMGVDRIAMLKFGIGDIRLFYENDLKFLEQF
ncbi:MAG: phenylalanine--tRNA ligase subunit alpha [Candidatus Omnitrophica bacterium]|nr:phenylalanine--tRNA ligase subunit alpha [Candidatus Omnitrophota bacterium]